MDIHLKVMEKRKIRDNLEVQQKENSKINTHLLMGKSHKHHRTIIMKIR